MLGGVTYTCTVHTSHTLEMVKLVAATAPDGDYGGNGKLTVAEIKSERKTIY